MVIFGKMQANNKNLTFSFELSSNNNQSKNHKFIFCFFGNNFSNSINTEKAIGHQLGS